jgi:TP901 family phage tail tape measure protein
MSMEDIGGIKGEAQIDIGPFEQSLKKLQDGLGTFNQKSAETERRLAEIERQSRSAGAGADKFSLSIRNLVPQLTAANLATRAIYDGLRLLEKSFTDPIAQAAKFQQTMANIASIIKGDPTLAVKTFNAAVLEMSRTIPKDPNDLGAGLYEVVSANITDTADALSVLKVSAKAAVGGLTDTKTSVNAITTVLNAYQLKASQAQEVSDSLFVAVRDGKLTYAELSNSLGLVISTAAQAKVPLDQMNAGLVALTLAGQQSTHAATDLNMFLDSVIKASKGTNEAAKMAKSLGIEYNTAALHAMGLAKFIQQVADKAGGNDVALQTLTGDVRGFRAIAVLAGSGIGNFNMALDDMKNKAGTAETAFKRNADTLENDWILSFNNLNAILIDAGQQKLPAMQDAVEELTRIINENSDAIESAASALSVTLVHGLQTVVEYAPTVIKALSAIASVVASVAGAIGSYLKYAGMLGEDVAGTAEGVAGAFRWDKNGIAERDKIFAAHKQGKLYQSVMNESLDLTNANIKFQEQNGIGSGKGSTTYPGNSVTTSTTNNQKSANSGVPSAGGQKESNKALENAKKIIEDINKIEKDIINSLGEQAKANNAREDALRDELTLKKEMGVITTSEETTLDRINNRVEYQKDKIKEATQTWKDQVKVVDELKKKIVDINTQIQTVADDLKKTLEGIDDGTGKSKADIVAKLLNEKADIVKASSNAGMSGDQSRRVGEINAELAGADPSALAEGTKLAGMNDLQKADYEGQQKKREAAKEANDKTAKLTDQLAQANTDLKGAQDELKVKIKAVTDAQTAQQITLTNSYIVIEKATSDHVKAQVAQLDLEKQHVDALAASYASVQNFINDPLGVNGGKPAPNAIPGHADGGLISGPGTGTSDSILARLSAGEYVQKNAAVQYYGRSFMDAVNNMTFQLPRFATGGPVSTNVNNSRKVTLNQHFHGDEAQMMSRPDLLRWHLRMAAR